MSTERRIARFLIDAKPARSAGEDDILASRDLYTDGWLDSLLQLRLLAFLEAELGTRVPPFQVSRRAFLSVRSIAALVRPEREPNG